MEAANKINYLKYEKFSREIRKSILKMVHASKASHVGSALSIVDILTVLYLSILNIDPKKPDLENRDRFFLSKGHACTAVYAVLAEIGFFNKDKLKEYSKDGSILMSHISHQVSGVEFSTGSLGHALPVSLGVALAGKKHQKNYRVFTLLSDGELNEGSNWEAFLMAPHLALDNLIVIIDVNKLQAFGYTQDILNVEPIEDKLKAFGWEVERINGHSYEEILQALKKFTGQKNGKPKVIIADTIKGKGVSFMEDKLKWHYSSPSDEDLQLAIKEIDTR